MKVGFDNDLYVKVQSEKIKERIKMFDKLYLEFGGKLFDDYHALRVLPGFKIDAKLHLLQEFKDDLEVIFCISASAIEKNKTRAEFGITYDDEVLRVMNHLKEMGIAINSVVITLFKGQTRAINFKNKLERNGIKTYIHSFTKGYPTDVDTIVSEDGYGANPYITTTKPLVIVTAPGPCSGKLATCLSQLYHEHQNGIDAGYAKFETFPVWNLPLKHPVNIAYEAATADLKDVNMIDPFHLEEHQISAVNYNRDIELFPVLKAILKKIVKKEIYKSPTDMGVNMIGNCIINDEVVKDAAKKEIVQRFYQAQSDYQMGLVDIDVPQRIKMLMNELHINENYLKVIKPALEKAKLEKVNVISLELPNKKIITGKETTLLSPPASLLLNAIKELSGIPDEKELLSKSVLTPILKYRLNGNNDKLKANEVLIALSIESSKSSDIKKALEKLHELNNCDAHATYIIQNGDLKIFKALHINITFEPKFYSNELDYSN